jgi:hypothetical protein
MSVELREILKPVASTKVCDKCGVRVEIESDPMEAAEFFHWRTEGGYASIWGDGSVVEIDLCQKCAHELLGPYVRITKDA